MGKSSSHPAWNVYDLYRTARLNVKYYSARLTYLERLNFVMELILLISAPSSAVAGLFFWDTPIGSKIWKILGIIAAVVAVSKPLLKLTEKIKQFEETITGYQILEHDLSVIKISIEEKQSYDKSLQKEFKKALERKRVLVTKCPEHREYKKLKNRCTLEVSQELPVDIFFIPKR
ncbi:hypothetical protein HQ584_12325 [Patescibacteria group bacterium]|nr:hypothetical protein [Patescibacteria group bacterium]